MRMSAEYAFGMVRPPDESMPSDSPIYRSLGILRFYSAKTRSRRMVRRNRRHGMVLFQADEWRARLAEKRADLPANHEVFRWRLQRPQRIIDTPRQGPPCSIFYLFSKSSWPIVGFLISVPCGDIV